MCCFGWDEDGLRLAQRPSSSQPPTYRLTTQRANCTRTELKCCFGGFETAATNNNGPNLKLLLVSIWIFNGPESENGVKIPAPFQKILEQDNRLYAVTLSAISSVKTWLDANPCIFFPEYTRHDLRHNEEVLWATLDLTTELSLDILSPADVATLIGAILLHDSAMHLSEDGFISLIEKDSLWRPVEEFDQKSWFDTWEDFLSTASRYDEKQ